MQLRSKYGPGVIEPLRLCIVLFFVGVGNEVGSLIRGNGNVSGPLASPYTSVLLGAAVGYVAGGLLARLTVRGLNGAERAIAMRSSDKLFGGIVGTVAGVLLAASTCWPILLIGLGSVMVPLFAFAVLAVGTLGFQVGMNRRHALLGMFGANTASSALGVRKDTGERIVDTSIAIDGRIVDVVRAGFLGGTFVVPQPVLNELQGLADAGDEMRRSRGRRGLETLDALRRERNIEFETIIDGAAEVAEVDAKLVRMCLDRRAVLLTLDTNLAKAASLAGCRVMNLHSLALALRPPVSAGETVTVLLLKAGREPGQAVGYLDDGTMVVVERARSAVGREVGVVVTSVLTTANGRMIFGKRVETDENPDPRDAPDIPSARTRRYGETPASIAARIHESATSAASASGAQQD